MSAPASRHHERRRHKRRRSSRKSKHTCHCHDDEHRGRDKTVKRRSTNNIMDTFASRLSVATATAPETKTCLRFFNLDLHASVIEDVIDVLHRVVPRIRPACSVEVVQWSLSGHTWVFGKQSAQDVKVINQSTWHNVNADMIRDFAATYRDFLAGFDGYIVTFTPVFALLYESFGNKPIIMVNAARYENPFGFRQDLDHWQQLNVRLRKLHQSGRLIVVSNSLADQRYLELGAGIASTHIPSLCLYTSKPNGDRLGARYTGSDQRFVIFGDNHATAGRLLPVTPETAKLYVHESDVLQQGFSWSDLYKFRGIIRIPYEMSTMSIFEQYSANVPLVFPSKRLLKQWIRDNKARFQSRYLPAGAAARRYPRELKEALDDKTWVDFWVDRADFYDANNMPHIVYFDKVSELPDILRKMDVATITRQMAAHNRVRQARALDSWARLLKPHFGGAGRKN